MSKSGANSTAISPPSGSGMVAGMGEAFSLDLNSGQGNFSVPFEVPQGVAGFKPAIKLEYTHGNGNGAFGLGWRLPLRQIERRLDFGVPGEGIAETFHDAEVELRQSADGSYHPIRELAFTRYLRQGDHWELIEKNGRRAFFGLTPASRVADPDHADRVQTWMLEREEDVNGNRIDYEYDTIDGYPYLIAIHYAKFVLRLRYEARADVVTNGRAGFVRRITQRCQEISLHLANGDRRVRSLSMSYTQAPLSNVSLLTSLQLTAHGDGQPNVVKNPLTFEYSGFDPDNVGLRWVEAEPGNPEPPPLTDRETALLVMDDLPLPGILANRNGRHFYWPNNGARGWDFPRVLNDTPFADSFAADGVQFVDMDATGSADMLVGVGSNPLNGYYENSGADGFTNFIPYPVQARVLPPFESGRVRVYDIEGDGLVDALYTTGRGLVSFRNRGREGWIEPTITTNTPQVSFDDPLVFMSDMTGDGMADIVRVRSGQVEYWVNLGHGRFSERIVMEGSPRLTGIHRAPEQILLIDVDGDGCSDLVRISAAGIELYVNRSGQSFAPVQRYTTIPIPIANTLRTVDLDGRASYGLLYNSQRSGKTGYVYFNWDQTTPPYLLQRVDNGVGLISEIEYTPSVEMAQLDRSEGRIWDTYMPFPLWVVSTTRETDRVRGLVAETEYRYHDAHFDPLFRRFQGFRHVDKHELGDESRASVMTKFTFLMNQSAVPGHNSEHAHLDRMLAKVETFSLDGSPLQNEPCRIEETEYDFHELETLPDGTKRVFVFVHITRKRYSERTADERVEEMTYEYDLFGNVTREVTRGFGTENRAPVPELLVTTDVLYATDPTEQIFQMAQTTKRDADGNLIAEVRRYYDGADFAGLPLAELGQGLLVREEHLVLSKAAFDSHYAGMGLSALGYIEQPDADGVPAVFAVEKRITYTPQGNELTVTTEVGRSITHVYDAENVHVIAEIANGRRSDIEVEPLYGKPRRITSHNGEIVEMAYDAFGRMISVRTAGDPTANPTRRITFDDASVPNRMEVSYRIDETTRSVSVSYFDGHANEVQKRVERELGEIVVSPWLEQNPWSQTKAEFEPTLESTFDFALPDLANLPARRTFFDGEGRPVRTVNYNGGVGRVEFAPFEIFIADANDNDPNSPHNNTPRRERVNAWNQRTAVIEMGDNGQPAITRYDIGLFGELLALRDSTGAICTYEYDLRGNRLRIDHRDAGLRRQWFNIHNDIVRTLDAEGNDISATRDVEGRITGVSHNGSLNEQFTYDDTTPGADGRLVDAVYANGHQQYVYNARGQVTQEVLTIEGQQFTTRRDYNDLGRETALIYPDGTRIERTYTLNGMVRSISNIVDSIAYDARNLPIQIVFANGVVSEIEYAPGIGRVIRQRTVGSNGTILEDVQFVYDLMQELVSLNDSAPGAQRTFTYDYDALSQLRQMTGSDPLGNVTHSYDYANGYNLTANGESDWRMQYNDVARPDRLTEIDRPGEALFNVDYSANGNITALPGRTLVYDFKSQLQQVTLDDGTVVTFDYDYRGKRVRRRATRNGATNETIYVGRWTEVRNGMTTNFVMFNGTRIAVLANGHTRWVHLDPIGSASFFSDENGTKIAQIAYNPFGNERRSVGTPVLRTFALHDFDETVGLYYMGRRWYAQEIGRFLTPDPLYLYRPETNGADPVQLRLYTYVGNDPLNQVDPAGLSFWSVFGAIVGVIVGIVVAVAVVAAFASGIGFGLLAIAGVIALVTVSYVVAANNQGSALGEFFRGFLIGFNAGMNATLLTMMGPVGAFLGGLLGTMIFLGAFDSIASNEIYQGIMGWSNWLMPMSWLVTGVGLIMWVLNGLGHLIFWSIPSLWGGGIQFFRIDGMRMDWSTGMLATRGGWVSNLNTIDTAYNMGNWAFVDSQSFERDAAGNVILDAAGNPVEAWHLDHEAGHNLNLAAFGSIFHFVGFIHEMGTGAGSTAWSEVLADSNDGHPGMWG